MILSGNETLSINTIFFEQLKKNFEHLTASQADALHSVIFTGEQIMRSLNNSSSVGIKFMRINIDNSAFKTALHQTKEVLAAVAVNALGNTNANIGIVAHSGCPSICTNNITNTINANPSQLDEISLDDITSQTVSVTNDSLIKLGKIYFGREGVIDILKQGFCVGIIIYLVEYPNRFQGLAMCGIDENGNPQKDLTKGHSVIYSDLNIN